MIGLIGTVAASLMMSRWAAGTAARRAVANTTSEEDLNELFDKLNKRHFAGKVKKRKVVWDDSLKRDTMAEVYVDRSTPIKLNPHTIRSEDDLENTLLHEMIHIYLADPDHGDDFCEEVRRLGLKSDKAFYCANGKDKKELAKAGQGRQFAFHGAFKSKADARKKEREVEGAFILEREINGEKRYIVATRR